MAKKTTKILDSCITDKLHFPKDKLNVDNNSSNIPVIIRNRCHISDGRKNNALYNRASSHSSASDLNYSVELYEYDIKSRNPNNLIQIPLQRSVTRPNFPSIFFSNVRSMVNKLDELFATVSANSFEIIVITESWLSSLIDDNLIRIPGYVTYRRDRLNNQRGGGLCTYINSRLNVIGLRNLGEPDIESQWFLVKMNRLPRGINSIILGTVYHPPQSDDRILRSHIFNCLDSLLAAYPNSGIILLGDFNQFQPGNLCSSFRLKKLVTKPTRGNNILDQAFSTLLLHYESITLPPVGLSDHFSVLLQPTGRQAPSLPTTRIQKRDCRASNKRRLTQSLENFNWTPILRLNSCEHQLETFQTVIHDAIDFYLPMCSVKKHPSDKPWITPTIKDTIKKRQQAWVKNDSQKYKAYHNKVIKLCKKARQRFYADKIDHIHNTDPQKWWDNIKMLSGLSNTPPITSITVNDTILRDVDLAELVSESFSRVADDLPPFAFNPIPISDVPDEYIISPEAVELALSAVHERKSVGPDEIPN